MSHPVETILITGAFGQVGKRCAEILLSRGRTVIAMELRNERSLAAAEDLHAQGHPGTLITTYTDLLDAAGVHSVIGEHRPGAFVHLAAIFAPASYRNPRVARKVNVEGTRNLVAAATTLPDPPLILKASSAAVYGSRNPYRYPGRIDPTTAVNPIDQYGEDKVAAEAIVRDSGLPHAVLRLAGVISPDAQSTINGDHLLLMRATPGDNRMHTVDARDVALAFANGVDRADTIDGKTLLIAGDETHLLLQRDLEDDLMAAMGLGRLGPSASLPGDPDDDRGWAFTGWFDTRESQALLSFQEHDWPATVGWVAESAGSMRRVLRVVGPALRPVLRSVLTVQRRRERRGRFADPWTLIGRKYGPDVLAPTSF